LQRLAGRFLGQHAGGQTPQVLVNQGQQLLASAFISAPDGVEDLRHIAHALRLLQPAPGCKTIADPRLAAQTCSSDAPSDIAARAERASIVYACIFSRAIVPS
jgi:hypothetical protein